MVEYTIQRIAGKAIEASPVIVGSVVSATLNFLGKALGFFAEHTQILIVLVAGFIEIWLMQN